jgi:hypothetical protein
MVGKFMIDSLPGEEVQEMPTQNIQIQNDVFNSFLHKNTKIKLLFHFWKFWVPSRPKLD